MNLTIRERHGGGFCVTLVPDNDRCWKGSNSPPGLGAYDEANNLTLQIANGEPVTFGSFAEFQRVLHGERPVILQPKEQPS